MLLMKFGTKNQYFPAMNFRVFFEFWGLIRMATIWVTCKAFPYCSVCLNHESSFWFRRHLEVRFSRHKGVSSQELHLCWCWGMLFPALEWRAGMALGL